MIKKRKSIIILILIFPLYLFGNNYHYYYNQTTNKIIKYLNNQKQQKSFVKNKGKRYKKKIIQETYNNINIFFPKMSEIEKINMLFLIFSIIKVESNYNSLAIGDKGNSTGLMQINQKSFKYYHKKKLKKMNVNNKDIRKYLYKPIENIKNGIFILNKKKKEWNKMLDKINKNKYYDFIFSLTDDPYFIKEIPLISQFNGGIYNKNYVKKVYKEFYKIKYKL